MEGYPQMTDLDSKQPAEGGKIWSENDKIGIHRLFARKRTVVAIALGLATMLIGMQLAFAFLPKAALSGSTILSYVGLGATGLLNIMSLLMIHKLISEKSLTKGFARRVVLVSAYTSLLITLVICVTYVIANPLSAIIPDPDRSWVANEANELTGGTGFWVNDIKHYEDKNHMTAVVETDDAVRLLELYYINGEWKAALQ